MDDIKRDPFEEYIKDTEPEKRDLVMRAILAETK